MKTITFAVLLLLGLCTGCATKYDITMTNGSVITSKGKPQYDRDRNLWSYTDAYGKPSYISGNRVTQVAPQSMNTDNGSSHYNPVTRK